MPAKNEKQRTRNEWIIRRIAELESRATARRPSKKAKADDRQSDVDYVYLAPGERVPTPIPGRTQVVIKRELIGPKVEVNTPASPIRIDSSGDEASKQVTTPSTAAPSSQAASASATAAPPSTQQPVGVRTRSAKTRQATKAAKPSTSTHHDQPSTSRQAEQSVASASGVHRAVADAEVVGTVTAPATGDYQYDQYGYYDPQGQYHYYDQQQQYQGDQYYDPTQYGQQYDYTGGYYDEHGQYVPATPADTQATQQSADPQADQQVIDDASSIQASQHEEPTYDDELMEQGDDDDDDDEKDFIDPDDIKDEPEGSGMLADPEVGERPEPRWVPREFYSRRRAVRTSQTKKPEEEMERHMRERPWLTDSEELDLSPQAILRASIMKSRGSDAATRPCWLRLRRRWLVKNYMKHFLADSNIRYQQQTFASLCHHVTTGWDCHPLCWQCYVEFDLPLCGLDSTINCNHCRTMGAKATRLRTAMLRAARDELERKEAERKAEDEAREKGLPLPPRSKKKSVFRDHTKRTGIPYNVFCQADADVILEAKNLKELPNPDWLTEKGAVGTCFPAQLLQSGQDVSQAVKATPRVEGPGLQNRCTETQSCAA